MSKMSVVARGLSEFGRIAVDGQAGELPGGLPPPPTGIPSLASVKITKIGVATAKCRSVKVRPFAETDICGIKLEAGQLLEGDLYPTQAPGFEVGVKCAGVIGFPASLALIEWSLAELLTGKAVAPCHKGAATLDPLGGATFRVPTELSTPIGGDTGLGILMLRLSRFGIPLAQTGQGLSSPAPIMMWSWDANQRGVCPA